MNTHIDKPVLVPFFRGSWQDWDGRQFVLGEEWQARISFEYEGRVVSFMIVAKEGTRTDGGSIPKIARGYIDPLGKGLAGFLPHDFTYGAEYFTREFNDAVLKYMIKWAGFSSFKAWLVHRAVRIGGGFVYKQHTSLSIKKHREHIQIVPISGLTDRDILPEALNLMNIVV